jgi:hypothetical protein
MRLDALQKALTELAIQGICPASITFEDLDFQLIAHEIMPGKNAYPGFLFNGPGGRTFINTNADSDKGFQPVEKENK